MFNECVLIFVENFSDSSEYHFLRYCVTVFVLLVELSTSFIHCNCNNYQ